jgi:proteasome lid subunit RPN8/RPN11/type II secretory pathway pseudopilin PulG
MTIPNFKIICSDKLMSELEDHCFSETKVEVGGFLIGRINGATAEVTKVVRAKHSVGKSTQLTFTHDTWNALHSEMDEADGTLIGWYHSHPNFGVFLSEHDQFIQQNFFKQEGNITIVVDPVRGRRGWFYSSAGKIVKFEKEVDTTKARLGKSATNSDENIEAVMGKSNQGVTMGKVILVSAITSILGAFLGYGLSSSSGSSAGVQDQVNALRTEITQLEAVLMQNGINLYALPTAAPSPSKTKATTAPSAKATTKPSTNSTAKATAKATASATAKHSSKPLGSGSKSPTATATATASTTAKATSPSPTATKSGSTLKNTKSPSPTASSPAAATSPSATPTATK